MSDDRWSQPGMIERLKELWANGATTASIAETLTLEFHVTPPISKSAVAGKVNRLRLPHRPSPIKRLAEPCERPGPRANPRVTLPLLTKPAPAAQEPVQAPAAPPPPPPPPVQIHKRARPCCWPLERVAFGVWRYCEAPITEAGRPYCDAHLVKAYSQGPVRDRALARLRSAGLVAPAAESDELEEAA